MKLITPEILELEDKFFSDKLLKNSENFKSDKDFSEFLTLLNYQCQGEKYQKYQYPRQFYQKLLKRKLNGRSILNKLHRGVAARAFQQEIVEKSELRYGKRKIMDCLRVNLKDLSAIIF